MIKIVTYIFIISTIYPLLAGNNQNVNISDQDSIWYTEEIIITATRTEQEVFNIPRSAIIVDVNQLKFQSVTRMPDALMELPEISVQRTTLGGGSPILRGLVGRHVLVLIDGVRLNNSTNRSGPHQYFNTIDANLVDRIEIVNGPGSVLYGSDALGGVINIITKRSNTTKGFNFLSDTRISSVDQGLMQHFQAGYGQDGLGITLGLSLKNFNHLRAGSGIGIQDPTGYQQWDGLLLLDYAISKKSNLSFSLQNTNQIKVPRFDRVNAGKDTQYIYDPQQRQLAHLSLNQKIDNLFIQMMKIDLSYHEQREGTNIISNKNTAYEIQGRINTSTFGAGVTFTSFIGSTHLLTYGFEYYHDWISSTRDTLNVSSSESNTGPVPYPGDPTYESAAIYLQDEIFLDRFLIIAGLRYSYFNFQADLTNNEIFPSLDLVKSNPKALSGNLNVTYKLVPEKINLFGGICQGFRAPNSNDLIAVGNISNVGIEVPNPNLEPEESTQYELGIKTDLLNWGLTGSVYFMDISNLIQRRSVDENDKVIILQKENSSRARIIGLQMDGFVDISSNWRLQAGISWTQGDNREKNEPLSMIPPLRSKISLKNQGQNYWGEFLTIISSKQDRLSPLDELSVRIGPEGTPGFVIFSVRGGYSWNNYLETTIGVENLFDRVYKIHGSGIYSSGRNAFLGLRVTI